MSREQLYGLEELSFQIPLTYIDVLRRSKTNLDNSEESIANELWNIEEKQFLSKSWSGSTRLRSIKKRPRQGCSSVAGRFTKSHRDKKRFGQRCGRFLEQDPFRKYFSFVEKNSKNPN